VHENVRECTHTLSARTRTHAYIHTYAKHAHAHMHTPLHTHVHIQMRARTHTAAAVEALALTCDPCSLSSTCSSGGSCCCARCRTSSCNSSARSPHTTAYHHHHNRYRKGDVAAQRQMRCARKHMRSQADVSSAVIARSSTGWVSRAHGVEQQCSRVKRSDSLQVLAKHQRAANTE
jgi:hypothetical protein